MMDDDGKLILFGILTCHLALCISRAHAGPLKSLNFFSYFQDLENP